MAAIAGINGKVTVAAVVLANIDDWSLDLGGDVVDTTAFGSTWKTKTPTVKQWSGKAVGRFDNADTTGQIASINALLTSVACIFNTDAVHNWSGSAIISQVVPKATATGVVTIEFSFVGNGALTYA